MMRRGPVGLPLPILIAEYPAPALPGGKVAKPLSSRALPGRITDSHSLPVDPDFAAVVVTVGSVAGSTSDPKSKPPSLTPDPMPEWLHLRRAGQVGDGNPLPPQLGYELVKAGVGEGDDLHRAYRPVPLADVACHLDRTQETVIPL
jgi:hypothetical protein